MCYSRSIAKHRPAGPVLGPLARIVRLAMIGAAAACLAGPASATASGSSQPARIFNVEAYDVDGVKLLPQVVVEGAVYPYMGPGRTVSDIEQARAALEKAYHDRGYQSVVVQIPAQSVADDIVRLHVIEAPIGRLRVTGARFFSPEFIRSEAPALREGQVPDIAQAQKEIAAINRLADRRVTPLLKAGAVPGTVDVDLKVSDTLPLHADLEFNNDHNQSTPPYRLLATVHYDNLWQLGHSLSATYAVAPQDRATSEVFAGSYLAPLWGTPWSLMAFGYSSNSNVASLGGTNVLGKGFDVGVRAVVQLPALADMSQSISFGLDYKHFDQTIQFGSTATQVPLRYAPFTLAYNAQRVGPRLETKGSLSMTLGLDIGGGEHVFAGVDKNGRPQFDTAFDQARAGATPNFIHLNLDLSQTVQIGRGFEFAQRLSAQLSDQPLVSNEEFAAGGLTSVRGYLQADATGDDGFTGSLEFRSPSLASFLTPLADELRFYAFADGGVVRVRNPLAGQQRFFSLVSAGAGVRLDMLRHLKGDVGGGVPLIDGADRRAGQPQIIFSVKSDF